MDGRAENKKAQPANEPENEKDNRDGIQHTNESLLPDWLDLFIFRYPRRPGSMKLPHRPASPGRCAQICYLTTKGPLR